MAENPPAPEAGTILGTRQGFLEIDEQLEGLLRDAVAGKSSTERILLAILEQQQAYQSYMGAVFALVKALRENSQREKVDPTH